MLQMTNIDPKILVSVVGLVSALISALIGGLISRWQTSVKFQNELKKLENEIFYRESVNYLKSARKYTYSVYIPISISLTKLIYSLQSYIYNEKSMIYKNILVDEIKSFCKDLQTLESEGSSAFITTDLEEAITTFVAFLQRSIISNAPTMKMSYKFSIKP